MGCVPQDSQHEVITMTPNGNEDYVLENAALAQNSVAQIGENGSSFDDLTLESEIAKGFADDTWDIACGHDCCPCNSQCK